MREIKLTVDNPITGQKLKLALSIVIHKVALKTPVDPGLT